MPTTLPEVPPAPECPMCGYPRSGLTDSTCPECGYALTDEDRANVYRWQMFLVFTRWSVWRRWLVLAGIAGVALSLRDYQQRLGPIVIFVVACVSMAAALAGSRFVPTRGLRGRTLRRCWLLSAAYGQVFWLLPLSAYLFPKLAGPYLFGAWRSDYTWEGIAFVMTLSGFVGATLAIAAFGRMRRHAGLTLSEPERTSLKEGLKLALAPHFLMTVAAAILGVMTILDRTRPTWWWGG